MRNDAIHPSSHQITGTDRAHEAMVGPIVDNDPEPFTKRGMVDPSRSSNLTLVVKPERLTMTVTTACPILVLAIDASSDCQRTSVKISGPK